jgi:hypothetical protein
MSVVERLVRLWTEPLAPSAEALAAFREAYRSAYLCRGGCGTRGSDCGSFG